MQWYYLSGDQRVGPLSDAAFQQRVSEGAVPPEALVWHEGLAEWTPYQQIAGPQSPAIAPEGDRPPVAGVACSQCGRGYSRDDMIEYNGMWVCATCKTQFFQLIREGRQPAAMAAIAGGMRYAGFWIRFVAAIIDSIILQIVNGVTGAIMGLLIFSAGPDPSAAVTLQIVNVVISLAIGMSYTTFFLGKFGATPGKLAIGLKVVAPDGSKISYGRAFGRYWAKVLSGLTLFIGYIIAGFDDQKRALHDHICSTRVIWKR